MDNLDKQFKNKKIIEEEDKLLLESFLKGNDKAFSSIYNKYIDELFGYGLGLGFERETLKDAIQDTFFKLYLNKKQLQNVLQLKYYLFSILRNRLLDIYRATCKENRMDFIELPFVLEASILDTIIEQEERESLERRINLLFTVLTDRQKEAVYLRFIQEMEYEEIANLLGMTAPAVRKLISRAIGRMREENF